MPGADPAAGTPRRSRQRLRAPARAASLIVGLVLAVGAPLWWSYHDVSPRVAAVNPGALHRLGAPAVPPASPSHGGGAAGRPAIAVSPVGGDRPAARSAARPTNVSIPSLSVDAPVRGVGVAPDGQVAIPPDIHTVGWFRWGAEPGARSGSVVLVGHLDSATQPGLGAMAYLRNVHAGAAIAVTGSDGRIWRYRVVARQQIEKARLPLRDIFSRTGRPRLVLMTCGGSFDPVSRSYAATVVVTAVPVRGEGGPRRVG